MYDPKFLPARHVLTYDTVPRWVVFLVELLLDEGCNVLLDVELLKCLGRNVDSVLLHVCRQSPTFRHVRVLNNCLPICHFKGSNLNLYYNTFHLEPF